MKQNMVIYILLDVFFNLSKVKDGTSKVYNILDIKTIEICARNASFSIINVFWGVRLQKVKQIC